MTSSYLSGVVWNTSGIANFLFTFPPSLPPSLSAFLPTFSIVLFVKCEFIAEAHTSLGTGAPARLLVGLGISVGERTLELGCKGRAVGNEGRNRGFGGHAEELSLGFGAFPTEGLWAGLG